MENVTRHYCVCVQNYYEKMEKRQERERDSSKKEHTTKLITPQVAKVEHTYRPGKHDAPQYYLLSIVHDRTHTHDTR